VVLAGSLSYVSITLLVLLLTACESDQSSATQTLVLPERLATPHVTDQMQVAGLALVLRDEGGGCRLQVGKTEPQLWLKPMAPCYFIKSPGSAQAQVYRHDKTTSVVAVVGTPVKGNRCGQEVQGVVIKGGVVTPSAYVMQGSVHCVDHGLQNFQYELFAR
jgi:hypothetical protein